MKDQTMLIRFSKEQFEQIMIAYKNRLIEGDYISRSEYVRRLILTSLGKKDV